MYLKDVDLRQKPKRYGFSTQRLWVKLTPRHATRRFPAYLLGAFVGLTMVLAGPAAQADINLVFGTYATDKPTVIVRKFKPFLNYLSDNLSQSLGEPVLIKMQISMDYQEGINDLTSGEVDLARFGPASYVTAKDQEERIEIIAMETSKGKKTFKGIIAVEKNSPIQSLEDLHGKSFAFGSRLSTIGRYLAQKQLLDAGITARSLSRYEYLGRHDRVGSAVGKKEYDAGALKSGTFTKLLENNVPLRVLSSFDNVTKPWLAKANIDETVLTALRTAFLSLEDPDILATISKTGFLEGHDEDYDFIRDAMLRSQDFDK